MNETIIAIVGSFIGAVAGALIFLGTLEIIRLIKPKEEIE